MSDSIQLPKDQVTQHRTELRPITVPNISLPNGEGKLAIFVFLVILSIFGLGVVIGVWMSSFKKTPPTPPAPTPAVAVFKAEKPVVLRGDLEARLARLEARLDAKQVKQVPIAAPEPVFIPLVEPVGLFGPGVINNGGIGFGRIGIRPISVRRKGVTIRRRVR